MYRTALRAARIALVMAFLLTTSTASAGLIFYDAQTISSTYLNTLYDPNGLSYTAVNGQVMPVGGGKRTTPGTGDPSGNDYFALNLTAGDAWDAAGLLDTGSGAIGGDGIDGTLYVGFLLRAHAAAPDANEPAYSALQLARTSGGTAAGLGNFWQAWAYSLFGAAGDVDLVQSGGSGTWLNYDTETHWMVAKFTFHAGAADDLSVWLDPNPDHGDVQVDPVRRYTGAAVGDLSFDQIAYRSGNTMGTNSWDFDEVRFAEDWGTLMTVPEPSSLVLAVLALVLLHVPALRRR